MLKPDIARASLALAMKRANRVSHHFLARHQRLKKLAVWHMVGHVARTIGQANVTVADKTFESNVALLIAGCAAVGSAG